MAHTLATARTELGAMLDIDVTTGNGPTYAKNWLNRGGQRVWTSRPWFGRVVETTIFTVAPYSTGTASFTQAGTSVTGSGTTWASTFTGRKIALGIGSPWYRFTRSSDTAGTIPTGGYAEATVADSPYAIFQDEYDLAATAETIVSVGIYAVYPGLARSTDAKLDDIALVHPATGRPRIWAPVLSQTAGTRRFRLYPIPDAIYRLRVKYLSAFTDLSADGDTCVLGAHRERAWLLASALEAQRQGDARPVTTDAEVEAAIELAWTKEQASSPVVVRRTLVGGRHNAPHHYINDDDAT